MPPEEITKALEQVEQEGTYTVETGGGAHARAIRAAAGGHEAGQYACRKDDRKGVCSGYV